MKRLCTAFLPVLFVLLAGDSAWAASYRIDPVHSMTYFKIGHYGIGHVYGRFNDISGTIETDADGKPIAVAISIDTTSVDTNVDQRDNHLRSADFLNAVQYPTMDFTSTMIESLDDNSFLVRGSLSLHGVEQAVAIEMEKSGEGNDPHGNYRLGAEGKFEILRSTFDMTGLQDTVGDRVRIDMTFEAIRQ